MADSAGKRKMPEGGEAASPSAKRRAGGEEKESSLHRLLCGTTLEGLCEAMRAERGGRARQVRCLRPEQTVREALAMLEEANVLSAPLVMPARAGGHTLMGFVDVSSLLRAAMAHAGAGQDAPWTRLGAAGAAFLERRLADVAGSDDVTMRHRGFAGQSLLRALEEGFLRPRGGGSGAPHHRIVLFDGSPPAVSDLVSESDVLRFLHRHSAEALGDRAGLAVAASGVPMRRALVVAPDTSAGEAFARMDAEGARAVAVVGDDGEVRATLSASDLRGMSGGMFSFLVAPVEKFLRMEWRAKLVRHGAHPNRRDLAADAQRPLSLAPGATVGEALRTMAVWRLHRLYVRGKGRTKLRELRITDLLAWLVGAARGEEGVDPDEAGVEVDAAEDAAPDLPGDSF